MLNGEGEEVSNGEGGKVLNGEEEASNGEAGEVLNGEGGEVSNGEGDNDNVECPVYHVHGLSCQWICCDNCDVWSCHDKNGPGKNGPGKYYARSQLNLCKLGLGLGLRLWLGLGLGLWLGIGQGLWLGLRIGLGLGLGLWLALRLRLELESVFTFKCPDRFCRRTKFNVTVLHCLHRCKF